MGATDKLHMEIWQLVYLTGNCICAHRSVEPSFRWEANISNTEMCKVGLYSQSSIISRFGAGPAPRNAGLGGRTHKKDIFVFSQCLWYDKSFNKRIFKKKFIIVFLNSDRIYRYTICFPPKNYLQ